jgi:phytoene desaturase
MRIVVVGSGLGGLSAAAHLVGRGHDVSVLERSAQPGGRASVVAEAGFRLDCGPTVLTMPGLVAETFAAAGREMSDYVEIEGVDPMYRAVFADGSVLYVRHGREAMAEEIRAFAGAKEAAAFGRFCDWVTELFAVEMSNFIDQNFDSVVDIFRPWRAALRLIKLGGLRRLDGKVASFFDDERLRRVFSFQSMYAGLAPKDALALYAVITYMDTVSGVFVPKGGMHALVAGLATAITDAGAAIQYNTEVTRILRGAEGAATGVELADGIRLSADAVVCNADLPAAYRTLIGGVDAPRVARRGTFSPSCLLWVAGVRGQADGDVAHHNIHFGRDWSGSFDAIMKRGVRMPDPSILVTLQSHSDRSLAPEGCTALSAIEPVPNLDGKLDWVAHGERFSGELVARIARLGYPTDAIVQRTFDPLDWEAMGMERGTPFALAHTLRQTGPFRPGNTDKRVPGLVFTGSSTLPGVGVPMVLVSGKLAADRVDEYRARTSVVHW